MVLSNSDERLNQTQKPQSELNKKEEFDDTIDDAKMKVECICPKCGTKHVMNLHWIGRGTPRKYCHLCRSTVNSGD